FLRRIVAGTSSKRGDSVGKSVSVDRSAHALVKHLGEEFAKLRRFHRPNFDVPVDLQTNKTTVLPVVKKGELIREPHELGRSGFTTRVFFSVRMICVSDITPRL